MCYHIRVRLLLVDGYNLLFKVFPKIDDSGSRSQKNKQLINDSREQLIELLRVYASLKKVRVIAYFEGEFATEQTRGNVSARFLPANTIADDKIVDYVSRSRDRHAITIITSDDEIVRNVAKFKVECRTSEEFAAEIGAALKKSEDSLEYKQKREGVSKGDVDYWLKYFKVE